MPIVKYTAVHTTPKAHLKYILNPDKNEDMKYVTGLNCIDDYEGAYLNFKMLYEHFTGEKYNINTVENGKSHIRIHSYIQSFDKGVTAEQAHQIGVEWAKEVFGDDRPIIISTHVNTDHVHNHIAVCPFDFNGKRWIANKKSLKLAREVSDRIAKEHDIPIIEKPKQKKGMSYAEWLAVRNGTSWKVKMADNIDRYILDPSVTDIDPLIEKMKSEGYIFTDEKRLIAKPKGVKYGCCTKNIGFGYSREMLEYRISNKAFEMSVIKAGVYSGIRLNYALYLREFEYNLYRSRTSYNEYDHRELKSNCELLTFLCENNIHSEEEFINLVNERAEAEKVLDDEITMYMRNTSLIHGDYNFKAKTEERNKLSAKKHEAAYHYKRYLKLSESCYDEVLRKRRELYLYIYKSGRDISPDISNDEFKHYWLLARVQDIKEWANKVHRRAAETEISINQRSCYKENQSYDYYSR